MVVESTYARNRLILSNLLAGSEFLDGVKAFIISFNNGKYYQCLPHSKFLKIGKDYFKKLDESEHKVLSQGEVKLSEARLKEMQKEEEKKSSQM